MTAWLNRWMKWIMFAIGLLLPGAGAVIYLRGRKRGAETSKTEARADNADALGKTIREQHEAKAAIEALNKHAEEEHARINAKRDVVLSNPEPTQDEVDKLNRDIAALERDLVIHRGRR